MEIKLSVVILVYNHSLYLDECLTSVVNQNIKHNIEILIGEDCSDDNSLEICKRYASEFPNIELVERPVNIGMLPNFYDLLQRAKGEYIAFLEGDDFWMDNNKLSKQIEVLEKNRDCSICYHNVNMFFEDGLKGKGKLYVKKGHKLKSNISDVIRKEVFMHTSSLVIRASEIQEIPEQFYYYSMGDIPVTIWAMRNDMKAIYIDSVMSSYRKNIGGITFVNNQKRIETLNNYIRMYSELDILTNYFYSKQFNHAKFKKIVELIGLKIKCRNFNEVVPFVQEAFKNITFIELKLILKFTYYLVLSLFYNVKRHS